MKKINLGILFLIVTSSLASFGFQAKNIYKCYGQSEFKLSSRILITVYESDSLYWMNLDFKGLPKDKIQLFRESLNPEEVRFTDTFINRTLKLRLDVFLDDMGESSTFWFHNKKYLLSCEDY